MEILTFKKVKYIIKFSNYYYILFLNLVMQSSKQLFFCRKLAVDAS